MTDNILYRFDPPLEIEKLLQVAELARDLGSSLLQETSASLVLEAQNLLRERGPSAILRVVPLTEAVLPDNTPRDQLLDTIRYQLNRCNPTQSLLIVDPYLFPANPDANYLQDLISLIAPAVERGIDPTIATKADRNGALEASFLSGLASLRVGATASIKYTNAFHDRFWIADDERGLFVGTSLNGVGRRYAVADYLDEADAQEIAARVAAIP